MPYLVQQQTTAVATTANIINFPVTAGNTSRSLILQSKQETGTNHLNARLLWSIIIAVLLLLIYFSFALLKDINRKNTNADVHL